jgi:uncharacterized protein YkwD
MNSLAETFKKVLMEAQKLRPMKSKWIGTELQWVIDERKTMLDAVNAERFRRGLPPVANVDKAERCAMGHIDYTQKFALYCVEMCDDN